MREKFNQLSIASNTNGIERVRQDAKFAFILESPMAEFEVNRNCTLVTIGGHFKIGYYAFAFQISQGYQGFFEQHILRVSAGVRTAAAREA